jgi:hypothetical protein
MPNVILNDQGIIEVTVAGDQTPQSVAEMGKQIDVLLSQQKAAGKARLILDDLLQIGTVPPDARAVVVNLGKSLDYDKLAMVGANGVVRLGSNLMFRAIGKGSKLRFFGERQKATEWLQAP